MKINSTTRKIFFTIVIFAGINSVCNAQLNKLCPISSTVYNKKAVKGMNLLLNTKDFIPYFTPGGGTKLSSSVQLVNTQQPFPPLWFQMGNPVSDTGNFVATTFLADIKIQKQGGDLTFFFSYPGKLYGSVTIDTANLQTKDTLIKYPTTYKDMVMKQFDSHDYQVDAAGNQLFASQVYRKIDARCLSNLESDSARTAVSNNIVILNSKDSIIFNWNPLDHISPCEMYWEYKNSSLSYGDLINWSHLNSARFANDGNILYSLRHIGLGKINRKTGEIMWKLGGKDTTNSIHLPDSARYFLQHDFSQREDGLYSVFSNGDLSHLYAEGLVYKIDEVNKTAVLESRYRTKPDIFSMALGSYQCQNDNCIINYGMQKPTATPTQDMAHILVKDKLAAVISGPQMNFSYQVHETKWAAAQRRPVVRLKKKILYSDSKSGLHDYNWYKIEGNTAIPVGSGTSFTPIVSGKYVVEAIQGLGLFKSYLVSDVFTYITPKKK